MHRKLLLRKQLLRYADSGAAYVPFCGDGDIAVGLYASRFVLGADLDPARVDICRSRLEAADIRTANCDGWPFSDRQDVIAVADFDSYAYPYDSFRAFWANAIKAKCVVMFFTDAQKQAILRTGHFRLPSGQHVATTDIREKRRYANFWLKRYCEPWIKEVVAPMNVRLVRGYLRGMMLYWGCVCEQ